MSRLPHISRVSNVTGVVLLVTLVLVGGVSASPPHPHLRDAIIRGQFEAPYFVENLQALRASGINSVDDPADTFAAKAESGNRLTAAGTFKVLCLMVEFSDNRAATPATYFDSMLFSDAGLTVRDYYGEISYGQLDIVTVNMPSDLGWGMAPETYAYYVNGQNGTGSYPHNSQRLCEHLVDMVDGRVNFSEYDNNGNGIVDVIIIAHAGTGAEYSGSNNDMWSHKWSISARNRDGVYITSYTVQPEFWAAPSDMTIGVYAHELGHAFGLPDLYDTDQSASRGIGNWGLMSYGSWTGPNGRGGSPAHPSAWSRIRMGFAEETVVSSNQDDVAIDDIETSGQVYRLWDNGSLGSEYFLVENRQRTGYDQYLPGDGLLIWHIDEAQSNNNDEWWPALSPQNHYLVALEQADGRWDMEHRANSGDVSDPFPGAMGAYEFNGLSTPNTASYRNGATIVSLENIGESASTMYADFKVSLSAGSEPDDPPILPTDPVLHQNYPNPFNPSTIIGFSLQADADVRLTVYNLLGRQVTVLADGSLPAGIHELEWDGRDSHGFDVASGVYFYQLIVGQDVLSRKMALLR